MLNDRAVIAPPPIEELPAAEPAGWTAADVMSAPVITVSIHESLWAAWTVLYQSGHRHLVVVDGHQCVGVIDDRRIVLEWPLGALRSSELTIGEVLRRGTVTVCTTTPVGLVACVMLEDGTDAVPVVDEDGRLAGLVTGSDLLALMAYGQPRPAGQRGA